METKGKIDVLAVIDSIQFPPGNRSMCPSCHGWDGSPKGNGCTAHRHTKDCQLMAARAAVAELIEAASDVNEWLCRTDRKGTAHQQLLDDALSALRSSQGGREGDEGEDHA